MISHNNSGAVNRLSGLGHWEQFSCRSGAPDSSRSWSSQPLWNQPYSGP